MEVKDLKLNFLWERNPTMFLDAPNPFWIKWEDESSKLRKFIEDCSIQQLIELLVVANKDKYSRDLYWDFSKNTKEAMQGFYDVGDYIAMDALHLTKKELSRVLDKYIDHPKAGTFFKELILELNVDIGLKAIVEKTLQGKTYTTTVNGEKTKYKIEQCPLEFLEIGPKMFRMSIDEAKYVDLGIDG
jgi:hypothetical protein